jgi:hypothetical protein
MDFVGNAGTEEGVKKAAGRYTDATIASKIVGIIL